jgi:membrane protein
VRALLHKIFESITQNLLFIIAFIAFVVYSGKFIEFQLKLFPRISRSAYSRLFNFIPLAVSYWFIVKAFCTFRHIEFDFTYSIISCPVLSIICWEFFGDSIKENQESSGDIYNNKVAVFVKNIMMNYNFFEIFQIIGMGSISLALAGFVASFFGKIVGIDIDKFEKLLFRLFLGSLALAFFALLMHGISFLYASINKKVERQEARQRYYENICKEYDTLCTKHEQTIKENEHLLSRIEELEKQLNESEQKD